MPNNIMSNMEEQSQPKIKPEIAEEIYKKFGKIEDAFQMTDMGAVLLNHIAKQGWESTTQFKLDHGMIKGSTIEVINELHDKGYEVKIGFPVGNTNDTTERVVLYHE